MAVREIVLMGDPVLREEAEQVSAFDRELKARPVVEAIRGQRFGLWPAD